MKSKDLEFDINEFVSRKMQDTKLESEDAYNPTGYADYLGHEKYHHSDKGCKIEMVKEMMGRSGEAKQESIIKKCLTHDCKCHKEGWEFGFYYGKKSVSKENYCRECGEEIFGTFKFCQKCSKKRNKESMMRARQLFKDKRAADIVRDFGTIC